MYFDFEDDRPDTPTIARPLSSREGVFLSIIIHLLAVIVLLVGPRLPWVRAMEERRQQALEEQRRKEVERQREQTRFVFVKPRLDVTSPKPVPRADLSDLYRDYIACLNKQDWPKLGQFVHDEVHYND